MVRLCRCTLGCGERESAGRVESGVGATLDLYLSKFTNRLDAKGRVSIPASFRGVLARDGFDGLYVYPSLEEQAVDCGGNILLSEIETLLTPFSKGSDAWHAFAATLFGESEILKIDGEGRIMVPDGIKTHTGITSEITFVGMGYKFQLWEPNRFRAYQAEAKGRLREARKRLEPHGAAVGKPSSEARE